MFGLTTTRRRRAELAAARAETARQRERADRAEARAATAEYNRGQALRQVAGLDADNRRLAGRNKALGEEISKLSEADPQYAAALETRLRRALTAAARYLAAYHQQKRRADRLQARHDQALGLDTAAILSGQTWQQRREDTRGWVR
ncbi:hypothetical protein [Streptomyces fumanus]|uniref:hypothetical protein n=1 Tax=Streptomyces fumanus TaxID=67302 RepID=UPI0033E6907E